MRSLERALLAVLSLVGTAAAITARECCQRQQIGMQFSTPLSDHVAVSVMHVSCTRRTLGGAQFCIALERLCLMVFRLPRGGGQSCSKHALRVLRPVLSSLFCPLCGVLLRFFARALRGADALKPARGAASRAAGCARLCGCALRLAQRRAGSHQAPVRAHVGRSSSADDVRVNAWRHSPAAQSC